MTSLYRATVITSFPRAPKDQVEKEKIMRDQQSLSHGKWVACSKDSLNQQKKAMDFSSSYVFMIADAMGLAAFTVFGAFLTRLLVIYLKIPSPSFAILKISRFRRKKT